MTIFQVSSWLNQCLVQWQVRQCFGGFGVFVYFVELGRFYCAFWCTLSLVLFQFFVPEVFETTFRQVFSHTISDSNLCHDSWFWWSEDTIATFITTISKFQDSVECATPCRLGFSASSFSPVLAFWHCSSSMMIGCGILCFLFSAYLNTRTLTLFRQAQGLRCLVGIRVTW